MFSFKIFIMTNTFYTIHSRDYFLIINLILWLHRQMENDAAKHTCWIFWLPILFTDTKAVNWFHVNLNLLKEPEVNWSRFRSDLVSDLLVCLWLKTGFVQLQSDMFELGDAQRDAAEPSGRKLNVTGRRDQRETTRWPSPADRRLLTLGSLMSLVLV